MKPLLTASLLLSLALTARAADAPATSLPPAEADSKARIENSPRHGEWIDIKVPNSDKPMRAYIVYPERKDKAPVVMVIMEIYGLTDWVQATTDQLAADGFIAIAPDFATGKGPNGTGSVGMTKQAAQALIPTIKPEEVAADLDATRDYALKLDSANGKIATVGFCWGGGMSFSYATAQPKLDAAVVFYGTPPAPDTLAKIKTPIAGFYGGNDNRVTSTVAATTENMKKLEKPYEPHIMEGAGHGFMRQHATTDSEANQKAAADAWPLALKFLRDHTK